MNQIERRIVIFVMIVILFSSSCLSYSYAANGAVKSERNQYITIVYSNIGINSSIINIDLYAKARYHKTIYGHVYVQKKGWFGWYNVNYVSVIGYNGVLNKNVKMYLKSSGLYRVKFRANCSGDSVTVYSKSCYNN